MTKPKLEVADVFRSLDPAFVAALPAVQRRVVQDIVACRTAALGAHIEQCDQCGYCQIAYDSCRNRHCPKCQAAARAEWMEARAEELLPVPYHHVVFTLPEQLSPLALQNKRVIYHLLFRAASETLLEIAADPQHLGARIGFFAVLHSWGQTLQAYSHS
jgi:Transposase zinc-binding domain